MKINEKSSTGRTIYYDYFTYKLVDCLEKCLIYGHIRRFAN